MPDSIPELDQELAAVADPKQQIEIILGYARKLAETEIGKALDLCENVIGLAAGQPDLQPLLAECLHLQGTIFLNKADYSAALFAFSKARAIKEGLANELGAAKELCFIGISQAYAGLYPHALLNLRGALSVFEANDDHLMTAASLNSIGHTYVLLDECGKALPYLVKSINIARANDNQKRLANALDSLCLAYLGIGDLDNALSAGLESVAVAREIGALVREAEHLLSVGVVHRARGSLSQAESCFQESLALARKFGFRFAEAMALRKLGSARRQQGYLAEGLCFLKDALAILREIGAKQRTYECLADLAAAYKEAGDFATALDYYEQFHLAKEAIFNEQSDFRVKSLEIAYEVDQTNKEKEIYYLRNVALQREVEERIKAQTEAELLSITDPLTGLFNRRHLLYLAERELAQATRYQRPLSLVIFDIDHFKKVNDKFGHAAGDKVLTVISSHVRSCLRETDVVGRYGGEEFVILLPQTNLQAAQGMAERVRRTVAALKISINHEEISVTISAGIAARFAPEEKDRLEQMLDRADRALYEAKETGRDKTVIYQQSA